MPHYRLRQYAYLIRLHQPIGVLLLLYPSLWALWLASDGTPALSLLVIFGLGVLLMRAAGCAINDFADRNFDAHVSRTHSRPLATQTITSIEALLIAAILSGTAFLLVLFCNSYTVWLSIWGLLFAIIYPFLKRVTHLPQIGLSIAFSWGIPMAFAAVTNAITENAWFLYATAIIWPMIYDTLYAMADREDDLRIGVKSTAILFQSYDKLCVGLMQIVFILLLIEVGLRFQLKWPYFVSLLVVGFLFLYHQWLIKERVPAACLQAFKHNHWVGFAIWAGIVLSKIK